MSNYPDDIRQHDNDPRSPFFEEIETKCDECGIGHVKTEGDKDSGITWCDNPDCDWQVEWGLPDE